MRRLTTALIALATSVALTPAALPATAGTIPEPKDDPFYVVPDDIASYADGEVIASRRVTAIVYVAKIPANTWQIKYRTNDARGEPTATVTTLMVPTKSWSRGARPLVSYQPAEDGVGDQCAPSYALRVGLPRSIGNSQLESALVVSALKQGWAVSVPDYEGPESQFLVGRMAGHAVLDGVRASLAFSEARLPKDTPVGLWGYSGGALASSAAGQLHTTYAPELDVRAVTLGGVVADIFPSIETFSGGPSGGALAMLLNGPMRAFPEFGLEQYLSERGRRLVAAASDDCIADASARRPFLTFRDLEARPGTLTTGPVRDLLRTNSPMGIEGIPTAPVYDYHATHDEMAPIEQDRALMRRFCAAGATVQHVENPIGEHISENVVGVPGALAFLDARFAGKPPRNTCARIPRG